MKLYLASIGAGLLVGVIYALLQVRSPAPPVVALLGLLGILVGEQLPPLARSLWTGGGTPFGWLTHVHPHVFGQLPQSRSGAQAPQLGQAPVSSGPSNGRDRG